MALERATLYGLVVYNNRGVSYGRVDPHEARQMFIRQALVEGEWETQLALLGRQPEDHRARSKSWSTKSAAKTCWWTMR